MEMYSFLLNQAGVFQTADKNTLAKRPIKKAKRRFPESQSTVSFLGHGLYFSKH